MKSFSEEDREALLMAHRMGRRLMCPTCRVTLDQTPVPPSRQTSYVRRRLVVTCPSCQAHLVFDRSEQA